MSTNSPYTAAITGGGFLWEETNVLLPLLQAENREELLKDERVNNRLLHINAETSRYRFIMEICRRYDAMPVSFWNDYKMMSADNQQVALFFVIVQSYSPQPRTADSRTYRRTWKNAVSIMSAYN